MNKKTNPISTVLAAVSRALENIAFIAPLFTRLVVGVTFFYTGRGKLGNLQQTTAFFASLGIPLPAANAIFISTLEFVGGVCLMAGLGTRIFAALLSSTMLVALLTADREALLGKFPADLTDVGPFVLLLLLAWLITFGAGELSLDRLVRFFYKKQEVVLAERDARAGA